MTHKPRVAIVVGATGTVGGQLCGSVAADGVRVHAVGRNQDSLQLLADRAGVHAWAVDVSDSRAADAVAAQIADDEPELAIAAVGGWYVAEPGLQLAMDTWTSTLTSNLTAHFGAARAFAPVLQGPRPAYVALNGIASHYPCEGSIAISVAGAGQRMMLDVLAAEGREDPVSFRELVVDTPILSPGQKHDKDEPTHTIRQVYDAIRQLADDVPVPGEVVHHRVQTGTTHGVDAGHNNRPAVRQRLKQFVMDARGVESPAPAGGKYQPCDVALQQFSHLHEIRVSPSKFCGL